MGTASTHVLASNKETGCPVSATLFGLFIDGLHQYLQDVVPDAAVRVQHLRVTDLTYADDVSLLACTSTTSTSSAGCYGGILLCYPLLKTIGSDKAKVMVLGDHALPSFTCNGQGKESPHPNT